MLITDQKMPGTTGTQLLENAVKKYPAQTRIMLTAYVDNQAILDAFHQGLIYRYLLKPWSENELKQVIESAFEIYSLKRVKEQLYQEWLTTQKEYAILKNKSKSVT